jgi:hypothetical protein
MLVLIVMLGFKSGHILPLTKVNGPIDSVGSACTALADDDSVLASGAAQLHHWNKDGSLRRSLPLREEIVFCAVLGGYYLVTPRDPTLPSQLLDASGRPQAVREPLPRLVGLIQLGNQLLMTDASANRFQSTPFAFLAERCSIHPDPDGWSLRREGWGFAKANQRQRSLFMRYAKVMIVRRGRAGADLFAVMNQLENRAYLFSADIIAQERVEGQRRSSDVPFVTLNLPGYQAPPKAYFAPSKVTVRDERLIQQEREWRNGMGLIRRFDAFGDGYRVAYEVPEFEGGRCTGFKVGLVTLRADFTLIGAPVWVQGIPLGPRSDGTYLVLEILSPSGRAQIMELRP